MSGQQANDLRDQRGRFLNDLAGLVDISSIEDGSGQVTVFVGVGQILVTDHTAYQLTGVPDVTNGGLLDVRYDGGTGPNTDITSSISGGRLKGLIDARDTTAAGLQTSLDTLTSQLVSQVNTQHRAGYGLDGSTTQDFFTATGTTAGTISMALTDRQKIAASSTAAGVPGNNVNALALGGVSDQLAGHRRGDRRHADPDSAITEFLEPDVILDVVQKIVREIATLHRRHDPASSSLSGACHAAA